MNSNPEASHSRCFGLQVRLARLARWNLDIISASSPCLGSCGGFLLLSAAGALDGEEFLVIEGSM